MAKPKYPWKSTPLNGFFSVEMPKDRYARVVAAQRKKYGEHWAVHFDKRTNIATYTRLEKPRLRKYDWAALPGTEQEFRFDNQTDAMRAMDSCRGQVRRQTHKHQVETGNDPAFSHAFRECQWLVAPMHDYLGFTLRRRQC